jgi:pimeloyl-ACP methyl ester carboxylesterase
MGRDRWSTVCVDDGTNLAVREVGPARAAITVVFCHGFCLHSEAWDRQRTTLSDRWGDQVRLVFFDHRGHGRSGHGSDGSNTIEQLGRDLAAVLRTVAPEGPVVLVGHSMGGMAALAYIAANADVVGKQVVGVALVSTAAGSVARAGIGRLLNTPLIGLLRGISSVAPSLVEAGWDLSRRLLSPAIGATIPEVPVVAICSAADTYRMIHRTPIRTITHFLASLKRYDATKALHALASVPVVVVCGTRDIVTPIEHSYRLAAALPFAEFVSVEGGRHMVIVERADVVSSSVERLVGRITILAAA